jgi:hypothetical protein
MSMSPTRPERDPELQRKRAVRTAAVAGAIAAAIYIVFILSGVLGR